jgi:hypothetical protein
MRSSHRANLFLAKSFQIKVAVNRKMPNKCDNEIDIVDLTSEDSTEVGEPASTAASESCETSAPKRRRVDAPKQVLLKCLILGFIAAVQTHLQFCYCPRDARIRAHTYTHTYIRNRL